MKLKDNYIQDKTELQQCECDSWGGNLMLVKEKNGDRYLVNKVTGKARQISMPGYVVGFSDDEIDFASVDKLSHGHIAHSRRMDYTPVGWYDRCRNGLIALVWMLSPDGQYFADEDGFGMEDNDEEKIYCVMNDNLEVIHPFSVVPDIKALLKQLAQKN